jgi:hypothetical protein
MGFPTVLEEISWDGFRYLSDAFRSESLGKVLKSVPDVKGNLFHFKVSCDPTFLER